LVIPLKASNRTGKCDPFSFSDRGSPLGQPSDCARVADTPLVAFEPWVTVNLPASPSVIGPVVVRLYAPAALIAPVVATCQAPPPEPAHKSTKVWPPNRQFTPEMRKSSLSHRHYEKTLRAAMEAE
jgi:hypothetical protein